MAGYPCCCGGRNCDDCGVDGCEFEIIIDGLGTFVTGAMGGSGDSCAAEHEDSGAPGDYEIDIGHSPGVGWTCCVCPFGGFGNCCYWKAGPFADCDDLFDAIGKSVTFFDNGGGGDLTGTIRIIC